MRAARMRHARSAGGAFEDEAGAVGETHVGGAGGGDFHPGVLAGGGVEGLDETHCCDCWGEGGCVYI